MGGYIRDGYVIFASHVFASLGMDCLGRRLVINESIVVNSVTHMCNTAHPKASRHHGVPLKISCRDKGPI